MNDIKLLNDGLEELGINVTQEILDKFSNYYKLLMEWNQKMNLTSITDERDVIIKHFLDSLLISKVHDMKNVSSLIDIGTGAGFPGVPIKIVFPHINVILMDSLNKRLIFLDEVCKQLSLESVETVHARAEDLGHNPNHREKYDLAVSRAVSYLPTLSEYCLPFVKVGGYFISYKSEDYEQEVVDGQKAVKILGAQIESAKVNIIPQSDIKRTHVLIKKVSSIPKPYPRKAGIPAKKPL